MALDRPNIRKALSSHIFNNFSKADKFVFENTKNNFNVDEIWFEERLLPSDSRQATVMKDGYVEDFGIYQVNVRVPVGIGTIEADQYIKELSILFKPGTTIEKNGIEVDITNSSPESGVEVDNWYVLAISIYWSCYMTIN
jgi:hypothetical protein